MGSELPDGYRIKRLDDTVSTNADCLDAARSGEASGLWVIARRQSGGRGSRGRSWVSQEGNLFASLMLRDPAPAGVIAELTFVASLAVRDALARLAQRQGVNPLPFAVFVKDRRRVRSRGNRIPSV